jgi:hypothetical protein
MGTCASLIAEESGRTIYIVHNDIDVAVIEDIAEGCSPAGSLNQQGRSVLGSNLFETAVTPIVVEQFALQVRLKKF